MLVSPALREHAADETHAFGDKNAVFEGLPTALDRSAARG